MNTLLLMELLAYILASIFLGQDNQILSLFVMTSYWKLIFLLGNDWNVKETNF